MIIKDNEIIKGSDITRISTIGSMYANGNILLFDDKGKKYLLQVTEMLKFNTDFNNLRFKAVKKITNTYLEVIQEAV